MERVQPTVARARTDHRQGRGRRGAVHFNPALYSSLSINLSALINLGTIAWGMEVTDHGLGALFTIQHTF